MGKPTILTGATFEILYYPLVNVYVTMERSIVFVMGKKQLFHELPDDRVNFVMIQLWDGRNQWIYPQSPVP